MEKIGLNELILSQHTNLTPPTTRTPGAYTLDGIFDTPALDIIKGGYAPFLFTNHRLSLVDIQ